MIDPMLIGQGGKPRTPITVYLRWDRSSALADHIIRRYGLEVPISFEFTNAQSLPAIKNSVCDWPDRIVVECSHGPL